VGGFLHIYNVSREPWWARVGGGALYGPIETVDSESCVKGNNRRFQRLWSAKKKPSPTHVPNVVPGESLGVSLLRNIAY
jgi:hypothetical protein